MAAMSLATEEELQAAQQSRPELFARLQQAGNEAASSSAAQPSSSAAPAAAPALRPVMLPSFGGMAPQFGLVQMGGPPPLDTADAAPQSKAASKASAQALREANNFAVPCRAATFRCLTRREAALAAEHRPVCSPVRAGTTMLPPGSSGIKIGPAELGQQRAR